MPSIRLPALLAAAFAAVLSVQTQAAELLGMSFRSFRYYAKKAGLKPIVGMEAYVAPGSRAVASRAKPSRSSFFGIFTCRNSRNTGTVWAPVKTPSRRRRPPFAAASPRLFSRA